MTLNKIYQVVLIRLWHFFNKGKYRILGKRVYIRKPLKITPPCISVYENVFVESNSRIEGITSYEGINFLPDIIISKNCTIQQNLHLTCAGKIYIGENTAIAANVTITDIHHPYENIMLPIERQQVEVKPVTIAEDCKIYNNVVILPGTWIGKHCTIGANSVVSGIVPDYSVVVGAPSKIIKRYCFEKGEWQKTDKNGDFLIK